MKFRQRKSQANAVPHLKKLRLNKVTYQLGDVLFINEQNDDEAIGKLLEIKYKRGKDPELKVQWFYKPFDVEKPFKVDKLSDHELYYSEHCQYIPPLSIFGKTEVMSLNAYRKSQKPKDNIFFVRAKLDPKTGKFSSFCY